MSTNSDHETIEELLKNAADKERRRCIGVVLNAYGIYTLSGHENIAKALDALALKMEHPDVESSL